jgi:hypothetical protein
MTIQRGIIYGTLVGAALIAYFWAFAWRDAGLSAVDYDAIAKELLALVFIALLIERAVGSMSDPTPEPGRPDSSRSVRRSTQRSRN